MTKPGTGYRNRGWISESMLKINTLVTEFGIIQNRFLAGLKGLEVCHNVSELLFLVNITKVFMYLPNQIIKTKITNGANGALYYCIEYTVLTN